MPRVGSVESLEKDTRINNSSMNLLQADHGGNKDLRFNVRHFSLSDLGVVMPQCTCVPCETRESLIHKSGQQRCVRNTTCHHQYGEIQNSQTSP
eukprot:9250537-Karenia_brevis.AAC.1